MYRNSLDGFIFLYRMNGVVDDNNSNGKQTF